MNDVFDNGWFRDEKENWLSSESTLKTASLNIEDSESEVFDAHLKRPAALQISFSSDRNVVATSKDNWSLFYLTVLGIGIPLIIAMKFQGLQIPHNDTWAFEPIATQFASTGHIIFNNWEAMTFIGQILWSLPFLKMFGSSTTVLDCSISVLAFLGLLSQYFIARRFVSTSKASLLVLSAFTYWGYLYSSVNFMTDVPAMSLSFIAIYFGLKYLENETNIRYGFFALFIVSGLGGLAVRQTAIAAPLAVFIYLIVSQKKLRKFHVGCFTAFLIVSGTLVISLQQTVGFVPLEIKFPNVVEIGTSLKAFTTFTLMIAPITIFWGTRLLTIRKIEMMKAELLITSGILLSLITVFRSGFFLGNYYSQIGILMNQTMGGQRPLLFSGLFWSVLIMTSLVSALLFIAFLSLCIRNIRNRVIEGNTIRLTNASGILMVFISISMVLLAITIFSGQSTFDRFLWPMAVATSVVIMSFIEEKKTSVTISSGAYGLLLVLLLVSSLLATLNIFSYEEAQWKSGRLLVKSGFPPKSVDAGFDWMGHNEGYIDLHCDSGFRGGVQPYVPCFPGPDLQAVVFNSRQSYSSQLSFVSKISYYKYGFFDKQYLYAYEIVRAQ